MTNTKSHLDSFCVHFHFTVPAFQQAGGVLVPAAAEENQRFLTRWSPGGDSLSYPDSCVHRGPPDELTGSWVEGKAVLVLVHTLCFYSFSHKGQIPWRQKMIVWLLHFFSHPLEDPAEVVVVGGADCAPSVPASFTKARGLTEAGLDGNNPWAAHQWWRINVQPNGKDCLRGSHNSYWRPPAVQWG